jgi:hypothetical protein|tara:strand:- start:449 stop:682 length:234 start_codon:yes stop_codon:yes gene_type:complete
MNFFNFNFSELKEFLEKFTEILLLVVSVSLLLGVLFGPEAAFIGSVYQNFATILNSIGQDGVIALVSIAIIFAILKR